MVAMKQHARVTPPRKREGARTCTTADATVAAARRTAPPVLSTQAAPGDAALQQYSALVRICG